MYIRFAFQQMLSLLGKILSTYRKNAIELSGFSSFCMVDYDCFSVVFLKCNLYLAVLF